MGSFEFELPSSFFIAWQEDTADPQVDTRRLNLVFLPRVGRAEPTPDQLVCYAINFAIN